MAAWMLSPQEALSAMTELFAGATSYWLVLAKSGGGTRGLLAVLAAQEATGALPPGLCFLGRAI